MYEPKPKKTPVSRLKRDQDLRHHYRAGNWTFDENSFLVSS